MEMMNAPKDTNDAIIWKQQALSKDEYFWS